MFGHNLSLLIIDMDKRTHRGKIFAPSIRIYLLFYNQVFNGTSFLAIARSSEEDRLRHFAPIFLHFRDKFAVRACELEWEVCEEEFYSSRFFNLRILNFPCEEFSFFFSFFRHLLWYLLCILLTMYIWRSMCENMAYCMYIHFLLSKKKNR